VISSLHEIEREREREREREGERGRVLGSLQVFPNQNVNVVEDGKYPLERLRSNGDFG